MVETDAQNCHKCGDGDKHSRKTSETNGQARIRTASSCSGGRKPLRAVWTNNLEMVTLGMLTNPRVLFKIGYSGKHSS